MGKTWENTGMAADESQEQKEVIDETKQNRALRVINGPLWS